jgi:tRNA threonylcarbamoyladenosine modification (KEOPS) complex Cgi121 subunit
MRNRIRDSLFRIARKDVIDFLNDHEEDLLQIFREELKAVDERIPEENLFIDIRMVALGEELMIAVLRALKRFMQEV